MTTSFIVVPNSGPGETLQVAVDLPLLGGSGSEDEMRFSRRVDDRETVVARLGGIKAQRERHAVEQRLQGDAQLKLGKRCPETMVLAPAEREMTIGRSAQQEALRLGEPRRVAVGRAHPGGDELPLLDRATAKLHRLFHGSPDRRERRSTPMLPPDCRAKQRERTSQLRWTYTP